MRARLLIISMFVIFMLTGCATKKQTAPSKEYAATVEFLHIFPKSNIIIDTIDDFYVISGTIKKTKLKFTIYAAEISVPENLPTDNIIWYLPPNTPVILSVD